LALIDNKTMRLFGENIQKVIVLFLFLIDYNNVGCLEMLGVGGPDWVHSGDEVELVCKYDLGREHIYSVKWYKVSIYINILYTV